MKSHFFLSAKTLGLMILLAAPFTFLSFGQQSPGDEDVTGTPFNDNPDPGDCCQCLEMLINGKDTPPPEEDERFVPEIDGSIKFKVTLTNLCVREISGEVQLSGIVPMDPEPVQTLPYVIPAGGTVTLDFTLPANKRRSCKEWRFQASCEGSFSGCPFRDFKDDCRCCSSCELSGTPTVDQSSFIARIPTTPSQGAMADGFLEFYTRSFAWPGRAGLNPVVPSNFVVTRDGNNLITQIDTGVTTLEVADVTGEDAFTVVHKSTATQQVIRTTKIEFVNEGGTDRLRVDTTFLGTTTRMEQTQTQPGTLVLQKGKVTGTNFEPLWKETLVTTESTPGVRVLHRTLEERAEASGTFEVTSDVERTWVNQINGWRKTKEVVNPSPGGQSVSLTSTWSYYQPGDPTGPGAATAGLGLLKHHERYDGYEELHTYTSYTETIISPFAGDVSGKTTTWTWDPVADTLTTAAAVGGQTLSKTVTAYTATQTITDRYSASGQKLTTITDYVASGNDFGGKPTRILYPDGTLMTCSYTRNATTGGYTKIEREGATTNQTTVSLGAETTMVYNSRGTLIKGETRAIGFSGTAGRVYDSMAVTAIDILGRPLTMAHHPDSITVTGDSAAATNPEWETERAYSCCGVASETDKTGVTTFYAHDILQRRVKTNRLGVTMETVYDGLTTKKHRYPEVVVGSLSTSLAGTSANLVSSMTRNLSGTSTTQLSPDPNSQVDGAIVTTTTEVAYQPAAGIGRRVVVTNPDTSSQTTDSFLDGKTATTTGTAAPHRIYTYAVNTTGLAATSSFLDGANLRETTTNQNDWLGRTVLITYQDNSTASMHYNGNGQLTRSVDPDNVTTLYLYNTRGQRTYSAIDLDANNQINFGTDTISFSETNPGVDGTATAWVTTNKVWQDGETNPAAGTTTSTTYQSPDGLATSVQQMGVTGRSISTTTLPGGGDWTVRNERPDGSYTLSTYVDGLMDKTENFKSNDNLVSSTTIRDNTGTVGSGYDSLNRVTHTDNSRTGISVTAYKSATSDSVHSVTDPGTRTTSFNYDAMGRRTVVDAPNTLNADGNTLANITNTLYDLDGTVEEVNGDQTYRRTYTYDYADRMVTMTTYRDPLDSAKNATTTWAYSSDRGFLTRKEYDDGEGIDYTYTSAGRLKTRTWARDIVTAYGYGDGGRLTNTDYWTNGTLYQDYLDAVNAYQAVLNDPQSTQTEIDDALDDVTAAAAAGAVGNTPNLVFTYDALGRQLTVTRGGALHASYRYDASDLVLLSERQQIDSLNRTIERTYDTYLRPTGYKAGTPDSDPFVVDDSEAVATWTRDNAGRLNSVTDGADTFTYGYRYTTNASGNHEGVTTGGSPSFMPFTIEGPEVDTVMEYDSTRNALLGRENTYDNGTLSDFTYSVNALGQRDGLTTTGDAFATQLDWSWAYNARGELTEADDQSSGGYDRAYQYDGLGNREKTVDGLVGDLSSSTDIWVANNLNQYVTVADYTPTPVYDDDGNLTSGPLPAAPSSASSLVWDAENRLISATVGSTTITYTYDYQSRLTSATTGGSTTHYLYDGWNRIVEYDATTRSDVYLWGLDLSGTPRGAGGVGGLLSISEISSGSVSGIVYPAYDGNGNVSEYVNEAGTEVAHFEYDPFGNLTVDDQNNASTFPYRFSTKPQDAETGLYYYGYRFYDPVTGRWPSRDPIGEHGGTNLYVMVRNDAANKFDFLGLEVVSVFVNGRWEKFPTRCTICHGSVYDDDFPNLAAFPELAPEAHPSQLAAIAALADPRANTDAMSLLYQYLIGSAPDEVLIEDPKDIKEGFLGDTLRERAREFGERFCDQNGVLVLPQVIRLGGELASIPDWQYPFRFAGWLFTNPRTAYVGSFSGGTMTITDVDCDKCTVTYEVDAINRSSAESMTRYPPSWGGYDGHGSTVDAIQNLTIDPGYYDLGLHMPDSSTFLPNDPFGEDGPMSTTQQRFKWSETVGF